jgi:Sulfotransferase family
MAEPSVAEPPSSPGDEPSSRPKVIYVLGAHRSGSTVLGVTLGNCADFFFAGEVHSWQSRRGRPSFGGEQGKQLWREVLARVDDAQALFGPETQLYVDRSSAMYRLHRWPTRRLLKRPYRRMAESLFRAISEVTGATHIVDTSHYPLRARELQAVNGIDLHIIFLTRDPQGIVASLARGKGRVYAKGPLTANLHLWITYFLSVYVFLRQPRARRLILRHEDFLEDPAGVLRQILDSVGSSSEVPDLATLATGSPLQGNRFMKQADVIALRPAPPLQRTSLLTKVVQAPWKPVLSRLRPAVRPRSRSGA